MKRLVRPADDALSPVYELVAPRTKVSLQRGLNAVEAIIRIFPQFASAWSFMAVLKMSQLIRGYYPTDDGFQQILDWTERALSLDPASVASLAVCGWALACLDPQKGEQGLLHLNRAVTLKPGAWIARLSRAWVLAGTGRLDDAISDLNAGLSSNPFEASLLGFKAWLLLSADRLTEVNEFLRQALQIRSDVDGLHIANAFLALRLGRAELAIGHARRAVAMKDNDPFVLSSLIYILATVGEHDESQRILGDAEARGFAFPATHRAAISYALGKADVAASQMEHARSSHCPWSLLAWCDPKFHGYPPASNALAS